MEKQTWIVAKSYEGATVLDCIKDGETMTKARQKKLDTKVDSAQCRGQIVERIDRPVGIYWDGSKE